MSPSQKRGRSRSLANVRPLTNDPSPLDFYLARILLGLAQLLVKHGYGHARLAKLAKLAFVNAAKSLVLPSGSKASIARIATLTGLTRLEVSRLLRSSHSANHFSVDDHLNRATRVAAGWRTDKAFAGPSNSPRALRISGSKTSFSSLVKKYSGDIPARAMLAEMTRLGLVSYSSSGAITLLRDSPSLSRSTVDAIRAISPWIDLLLDPRNSAPMTALTSETHQIKIHFDTFSEALAAIQELKTRQRSFVSGLEQLGTKPEGLGAHAITISVAVATAKPVNTKRRKKHKGEPPS